MKRRTVFRIVIAVLAVHLAFFWMISGMHVLPKRQYIAPPNFDAKEASAVNPANGEKITVREFTVSTKLAKQASAGQ